jgi:hypothetical protein
MRHEILALHDAYANDPQVCHFLSLGLFPCRVLTHHRQFFPMCTNLAITGNGSSPLPEAQGIRLPGGYHADDPNLHVNIWDGSLEKREYVAPGPRPYTSAPRRARRDAFACNFAHSNRRDLVACQ